jgi:uncharacterized membrane protein
MGAGDATDDRPVNDDLQRLLMFSDAVFAIALTLLVLDLNVPSDLSPAQLDVQLRQLTPHLLSAALSFAVIARFWLAHHEIFRHVHRLDRVVLMLGVVLLAPIVLVPFSAALLAEYGHLPVPVVVYSVTVATAAVLEIAILSRGTRPGADDRSRSRTVRRIIVATAVAAAGFVAAIPLAFLSPDWAKLCWLAALVPVERLVR